MLRFNQIRLLAKVGLATERLMGFVGVITKYSYTIKKEFYHTVKKDRDDAFSFKMGRYYPRFTIDNSKN